MYGHRGEGLYWSRYFGEIALVYPMWYQLYSQGLITYLRGDISGNSHI